LEVRQMAAKKQAAKQAVKKQAVKKQAVKQATQKQASTAPKKAAAKRSTPSVATVVKKAVKKTPKPVAKPAKPVAPAAQAFAVGSSVPEFTLPDQAGRSVTLASLQGKPWVLYFYPKDDTPGCTAEACDFRDEAEAFAVAGARVVGVSPDKPESHARFATKYELPFTLLADTDHALADALGVWKLKQNYGREYWGIERSTFVIDAEGVVQKVWRGVRVAGHVQAVLEALRALR
jgi:peroxiredoxin Q/BCP